MSAEEIKAGVEVLRAVADAIRELKQVPSGHLYARLMGYMDLAAYERIIGVLKNAGLVREENHLLIWVEPAQTPSEKPCNCDACRNGDGH